MNTSVATIARQHAPGGQFERADEFADYFGPNAFVWGEEVMDFFVAHPKS